jgi:HK97 family phage major capsid protein
LTSLINELFPMEFNFKVDDEMINGSGAGQCLGILKSGCLVTVDKEAGQEADSIYAENVEKMFARMYAAGLPKSVWHINQDCWPQIFQLHHVIGTGGVPMYIGPGALLNAPFGTLLGRPIEPIEQAATVGDLGDITLCDWSQYGLVEKGGLQSASSIHVKFVEGETAFRFTLRINGRPIWATALTPYQGSATQSPFVALAARA